MNSMLLPTITFWLIVSICTFGFVLSLAYLRFALRRRSQTRKLAQFEADEARARDHESRQV